MSSTKIDNDIFCSCIIATIGRDTVVRSVNSVLSQSLRDRDFEIILVNDSGKSLAQFWERYERVQVIDTDRRERSMARNAGAAIARGRYFHFLDDDDWLAQGAYQHLWELSQSTDAKWLYGMTQVLDRENKPTVVLQHGLQGNCFVQA